MNIIYHWEGDYRIPDLDIGEQTKRPIGHYGRMRRLFLQEQRSIQFSIMVLNGTLYSHLIEVEELARLRLDMLVSQIAKQMGCTEALKASDSIKWVKRMNACKSQVEEGIFRELICA